MLSWTSGNAGGGNFLVTFGVFFSKGAAHFSDSDLVNLNVVLVSTHKTVYRTRFNRTGVIKAPTEISRDGQQPLFVAPHANCRAIVVTCVAVHND